VGFRHTALLSTTTHSAPNDVGKINRAERRDNEISRTAFERPNVESNINHA
jgi:hypothetical protein